MPITATVEKFSPERALDILEHHNPHNRTPSPNRVLAYASAMRKDDWRIAQPISFDADGNLLDGQNRLMAVVRANVTVEFLAVRGLDPDAQETMDTGKARGLSDVLALRGYHNTAALGASISWAWRQENNRLNRRGTDSSTTIQEKIRLFEERWLDLIPATTAGMTMGRTKMIRPGMGTWLYCCFNRLDPVDAAAFYDAIRLGNDLPVDSPIFLLRRYLIDQISARAKNPDYVTAAMIVKAWNLWRAGSPAGPGQIRFRAGGASPEPFPEPL